MDASKLDIKHPSFEPFEGRLIAHRGLYENGTDHPENTLAAFERAAQAGYGIELDVRLTSDNQLVVAHDTDLQRLCGLPATFRETPYDQLRELPVLGSAQTVPSFADVLGLIAGRVPLVVEIKPELADSLTCRLTDQALRDYPGAYCIESFDPRVLLWYRLHRPDVLRGQLGEDVSQDIGTGLGPLNRLLSAMVFNAVTAPHFIAYNIRDAASPALHWWRRRLRCPLIAWTVKTPAELAKAQHSFAAYIFEGFTPEQPV